MPRDKKTSLRPVGDTAGGKAGERLNSAVRQSQSAKELTPAPNNTPRNPPLESIKAKSTGQSADSRSHTVDRGLFSGHQKLPDTDNSRASLLSSGRSVRELKKTVSSSSGPRFSIESSPLVRSSFIDEITDSHHLKGRKNLIPEQGSNRPKTAPSSSAKKEISKQYKPIKTAKDLSVLLIKTDCRLKPSTTAHDGDVTSQQNIDLLFTRLKHASTKTLKGYEHEADWLYLFPLTEKIISEVIRNQDLLFDGKHMFGGDQKIRDIINALMAIKVDRGLHEIPPTPSSASATPFVDSIDNSSRILDVENKVPQNSNETVVRKLFSREDDLAESTISVVPAINIFSDPSLEVSSLKPVVIREKTKLSPLKSSDGKEQATFDEFSNKSKRIEQLTNETTEIIGALTKGKEIETRLSTDFNYDGVNLTQTRESLFILPSDNLFLGKVNADLDERLEKAQWLRNSAGEIGPLIAELKNKLLECEETTEGLNEIYDYIRDELPKEYIARLDERGEDTNKDKEDILDAIDALLNSSLYVINNVLPQELQLEVKDLNSTNLASAIKKFCTTCDLEAQKERTKIANKLGFNSYNKATNKDVNQNITRARFSELFEEESRKKRSEFFSKHLAPTLKMETSSVWHGEGGMKEGIEALKKKIEDLTEQGIELSEELEDSKESLLAREDLIDSAELENKAFLNRIYTNISGEVLEEGRDIEFQTLMEKLSEFKEKLDSVPAGITEESLTLKEQRKTITRQTSEISSLQAQATSSIEANKLTQKELTDLANRLGMNGYSDDRTDVNNTVTAQDISAEVTLIIERINFLQLENKKFESFLMAGEDFNADVKKTKEFSTQTDAPLDGFSMQPATPPDYSEILVSICAVVVDLKDTLRNLNLVAEGRWSEAREVASEDLERQGKRESRRKEKDLLKKEEKEAEAERRREDEEKNTKRDQFINDLREELAQLKLEMEQEKKTAVDVLKAEKAEREKAAKDARTTKEKEDKEKAVKDEKDAKEKAVEDAKGPLQKFYDALEVQINKNPGRTILTPSGVSLKDLKKMRIDPKSLQGSIIPTAADKKSR